MSSPIASPNRGVLRNLLIEMHQKLSHNRRVHILAERIAALITEASSGAETVRCLDVGCGDMKVSSIIENLDQRLVWNCLDLYDLPEDLKESKTWARYQKYDGRHIPLGDGSMDIVMLCDVLHHAADAEGLLREAARVGRIIVVKDHFEYSLYSRAMLKMMDIFGNWGYGVSLPKRYFRRGNFEGLCLLLGLSVKKIEVDIDLYSRLPGINCLLRPSWHFLAVLESQ